MSTSTTYPLQVVLSAIDHMTQPLQVMGASVGVFTSHVNSHLNSISQASNNVAESIKTMAQPIAIAGVGVLALGDHIATTTARMDALAQASQIQRDRLLAIGQVIEPLGFDFEQVTDLAEEMINKFGESAGMGEMTGSTADALKMIGLSFEEIKKQSPDQQFETVINSLMAMTDASQAQAAADVLMGAESNRIIAALRNTGMTVDELTENYNKLNFLTDQGVEGSREYAAASNRLKTSISSMAQQFAGLGAKALGPVIVKYTELIAKNKELISNKINSFLTIIVKNIDNIVKASGMMIGAILVFKTYRAAVFAATLAMNAFKLAWLVLTAPIKIATAAMAAWNVIQAAAAVEGTILNAVMTANPIGLLIVGITALIGVGALLVANWDKVSSLFKHIWGMFTAIGEAIGGALMGDFEPLLNLPSKILEHWEGVTEFFSGLADHISDVVNSVSSFFGFGEDEAKKAVARVTIDKPETPMVQEQANTIRRIEKVSEIPEKPIKTPPMQPMQTIDQAIREPLQQNQPRIALATQPQTLTVFKQPAQMQKEIITEKQTLDINIKDPAGIAEIENSEPSSETLTVTKTGAF